MRSIYIKNISGATATLNGKEFTNNEEYQIPNSSVSVWLNDYTFTAVNDEDFQIGDGDSYFASYVDQMCWLGSEVPPIVKTEPFAVPDYRTKRNGCASSSCAVNSATNIDFKLEEELYVHGGELGVENAEVGDYVEACIYDKDSIIPEAYRSALCEDWPVVASYVIRHNVKPIYDGKMNAKEVLSTYPLSAKVTEGLYMRITYNAVNTGSARNVLVDYCFSRKL